MEKEKYIKIIEEFNSLNYLKEKLYKEFILIENDEQLINFSKKIIRLKDIKNKIDNIKNVKNSDTLKYELLKNLEKVNNSLDIDILEERIKRIKALPRCIKFPNCNVIVESINIDNNENSDIYFDYSHIITNLILDFLKEKEVIKNNILSKNLDSIYQNRIEEIKYYARVCSGTISEIKSNLVGIYITLDTIKEINNNIKIDNVFLDKLNIISSIIVFSLTDCINTSLKKVDKDNLSKFEIYNIDSIKKEYTKAKREKNIVEKIRKLEEVKQKLEEVNSIGKIENTNDYLYKIMIENIEINIVDNIKVLNSFNLNNNQLVYYNKYVNELINIKKEDNNLDKLNKLYNLNNNINLLKYTCIDENNKEYNFNEIIKILYKVYINDIEEKLYEISLRIDDMEDIILYEKLKEILISLEIVDLSTEENIIKLINIGHDLQNKVNELYTKFNEKVLTK